MKQKDKAFNVFKVYNAKVESRLNKGFEVLEVMEVVNTPLMNLIYFVNNIAYIIHQYSLVEMINTTC